MYASKMRVWLAIIIEMVLLIVGGYKLITLQSDNATQIENAWVAIQKIYYAHLESLSPEKAKIFVGSVEPLLKNSLGTKKTYCYAPAKYAFPPSVWTVEGLEAVENIEVSYGSIVESCDKTNIEVKLGAVGTLKQVEAKVASLEYWFWIFAAILMILKISEIAFPRDKAPISKKIRKKKRR